MTAADEQISKAEAIRRILDRALETGDPEAEARVVIESTAGIRADCSAWPEWQRAVRCRPAAERLLATGL